MSRPALLLGLSGAILMVPPLLFEARLDRAPAPAVVPAAATHVCVTPDLLCPIPAMRSGSPCGCAAGLRGRVDGHAARLAALLEQAGDADGRGPAPAPGSGHERAVSSGDP